MPGSWYRQKSAECGRQAQDASRTVEGRAKSKLEATHWLLIADRADTEEAARLARLTQRGK